MRNLITFLLILSGLTAPALFSLAYCSSSRDSRGIDINEGGENKGGDDKGGPVHRAPALIPIEAAYEASLSGIVVNFIYDLGTATVSVKNLMTAVVSRSVIGACQGVLFLPISGEAGVYEITFTLADGRWYWGTFEIG